MAARYCSVCRTHELSESAPYMPVGYVTRPIAWLIVVIVVGWVCHHITSVFSIIWIDLAWLLFHVVGVPLCGVVAFAIRLGFLTTVLYVISQLAPKSAVGTIAGLVLRFIIILMKLGSRAVITVGQALFRVVEGRRQERKKMNSKKA